MAASGREKVQERSEVEGRIRRKCKCLLGLSLLGLNYCKMLRFLNIFPMKNCLSCVRCAASFLSFQPLIFQASSCGMSEYCSSFLPFLIHTMVLDCMKMKGRHKEEKKRDKMLFMPSHVCVYFAITPHPNSSSSPKKFRMLESFISRRNI